MWLLTLILGWDCLASRSRASVHGWPQDNLIIFGGASGTGMSQGRTLSTQYNVVEIEDM